MSNPDRTSLEPEPFPDEVERGARKHYQPPRILSREPLEALANVCNQAGSKADTTVPGCGFGPPQS